MTPEAYRETKHGGGRVKTQAEALHRLRKINQGEAEPIPADDLSLRVRQRIAVQVQHEAERRSRLSDMCRGVYDSS